MPNEIKDRTYGTKVNDTNTKGLSIAIMDILNLKINLGSQRALAIGLKYLSLLKKETNIILMDADGEDDPNLLRKIIDSSKKFPNKSYRELELKLQVSSTEHTNNTIDINKYKNISLTKETHTVMEKVVDTILKRK